MRTPNNIIQKLNKKLGTIVKIIFDANFSIIIIITMYIIISSSHLEM
jgi:hypothetical protein